MLSVRDFCGPRDDGGSDLSLAEWYRLVRPRSGLGNAFDRIGVGKSCSHTSPTYACNILGRKGVRRRSPPPVSGDFDRVSPVPVFSLNYGAILAIAPIFRVLSARNRGARRAAIPEDLEFYRSSPGRGRWLALARRRGRRWKPLFRCPPPPSPSAPPPPGGGGSAGSCVSAGPSSWTWSGIQNRKR